MPWLILFVLYNYFSLLFYLKKYGNFANLFENLHTCISLLKWTSTYTVELWTLELVCLEHHGSLELFLQFRQFPYMYILNDWYYMTFWLL